MAYGYRLAAQAEGRRHVAEQPGGLLMAHQLKREGVEYLFTLRRKLGPPMRPR